MFILVAAVEATTLAKIRLEVHLKTFPSLLISRYDSVMKLRIFIGLTSLALLFFFKNDSFGYTAMTLPGSLFSVTAEPSPGFASKSEVGMAFYEGNTDTNLTSLSQEFSHRWQDETVQLLGQFLEQNVDDTLKAERWKLAARYERRLVHYWGAFAVESFEGNRFAGYFQRYSTDGGIRHVLWEQEKTKGALEAGLRYQIEDQTGGAQINSTIGRLFFETAYLWNAHAYAAFAVEYLPRLSEFSNWRLGMEADLNVVITGTLSWKTAYGIRYASVPSAFGVKNLDRSLINSIVAQL